MRRTIRIGAVLLLLAGLALIGHVFFFHGPDPSTTVPHTISTSTPPVTPEAGSGHPRAVQDMPASVPVRIVIPAIGVNAPIMTVGMADGAVGVPPLSSHNLVAWFNGSVTPGQDGPSLIDGHVDSYTGPSVFFNLKNLRQGDIVRILRSDGTTVTFRVAWVQVTSKSAFPWGAVLGPMAYPALRLVTCGGPFDYATGHYTDNIIVYARMA